MSTIRYICSTAGHPPIRRHCAWGREDECVRLIAAWLQADGITSHIYASAPGRSSVIARLNAGNAPDPAHALMLLGHLDSIAPGISAGTTVKEGQVVGAVGDTASPRIVHLHLEVRRVRDGTDLSKVPAGAPMIADSVTVVSDPRNVLPLK